jgi:NADPH:quinone reductase-like Zn-dependent oxidoreductase
LQEWGTLEQSLKATAIGGQIDFIGMLAGGAPKIDLNVLYNSIATVRVVAAGSRSQFIAMNRAIAVNRLRPVIDSVFPFDKVVDALHYYERTHPFGKVVISQR